MSVFTYDPIEAQRELIRYREKNAEMYQRGVDYYASRRGRRNAETAEKFRSYVRAFQELVEIGRAELEVKLAEAANNG